MSYILEAMRKSERDATMGQQINLPSSRTSWIRKLTYPIVGLVLVGFIAAALWLAINWQSPAPRTSLSVSDAAASEDAPAPSVASATSNHQTIEISIDPEPMIEPPTPVVPVPSEPPPQQVASASSWQELPDMARYITELPESLLRLRIGIHVFDQTPSRRFLLINGRRYQQGDELGGINGARITEITPAGIAIKYRQLHFHMKR